MRAHINRKPNVVSLLFGEVWNRYSEEKVPDRPSTRRGYLTWAKNYTLPKWGMRTSVSLHFGRKPTATSRFSGKPRRNTPSCSERDMRALRGIDSL